MIRQPCLYLLTTNQGDHSDEGDGGNQGNRGDEGDQGDQGSGVSILTSYGENPHYVKLPIFSDLWKTQPNL